MSQTSCIHPSFVSGVCVLCGISSKDNRGSNVAISNRKKPEISKKILLVLDLDHTLLHATQCNDRASMERYKNHPNLHFIQIRETPFITNSFYIKFRPHLPEFLEEMHKFCDLTIFTAGTRKYAEALASLMDPHHRYFQGRIVSRSDSMTYGMRNSMRRYRHFKTTKAQQNEDEEEEVDHGSYFSGYDGDPMNFDSVFFHSTVPRTSHWGNGPPSPWTNPRALRGEEKSLRRMCPFGKDSQFALILDDREDVWVNNYHSLYLPWDLSDMPHPQSPQLPCSDVDHLLLIRPYHYFNGPHFREVNNTSGPTGTYIQKPPAPPTPPPSPASTSTNQNQIQVHNNNNNQNQNHLHEHMLADLEDEVGHDEEADFGSDDESESSRIEDEENGKEADEEKEASIGKNEMLMEETKSTTQDLGLQEQEEVEAEVDEGDRHLMRMVEVARDLHKSLSLRSSSLSTTSSTKKQSKLESKKIGSLLPEMKKEILKGCVIVFWPEPLPPLNPPPNFSPSSYFHTLPPFSFKRSQHRAKLLLETSPSLPSLSSPTDSEPSCQSFYLSSIPSYSDSTSDILPPSRVSLVEEAVLDQFNILCPEDYHPLSSNRNPHLPPLESLPPLWRLALSLGARVGATFSPLTTHYLNLHTEYLTPRAAFEFGRGTEYGEEEAEEEGYGRASDDESEMSSSNHEPIARWKSRSDSLTSDGASRCGESRYSYISSELECWRREIQETSQEKEIREREQMESIQKRQEERIEMGSVETGFESLQTPQSLEPVQSGAVVELSAKEKKLELLKQKKQKLINKYKKQHLLPNESSTSSSEAMDEEKTSSSSHHSNQNNGLELSTPSSTAASKQTPEVQSVSPTMIHFSLSPTSSSSSSCTDRSLLAPLWVIHPDWLTHCRWEMMHSPEGPFSLLHALPTSYPPLSSSSLQSDSSIPSAHPENERDFQHPYQSAAHPVLAHATSFDQDDYESEEEAIQQQVPLSLYLSPSKLLSLADHTHITWKEQLTSSLNFLMKKQSTMRKKKSKFERQMASRPFSQLNPNSTPNTPPKPSSSTSSSVPPQIQSSLLRDLLSSPIDVGEGEGDEEEEEFGVGVGRNNGFQREKQLYLNKLRGVGLGNRPRKDSEDLEKEDGYLIGEMMEEEEEEEREEQGKEGRKEVGEEEEKGTNNNNNTSSSDVSPEGIQFDWGDEDDDNNIDDDKKDEGREKNIDQILEGGEEYEGEKKDHENEQDDEEEEEEERKTLRSVDYWKGRNQSEEGEAEEEEEEECGVWDERERKEYEDDEDDEGRGGGRSRQSFPSTSSSSSTASLPTNSSRFNRLLISSTTSTSSSKKKSSDYEDESEEEREREEYELCLQRLKMDLPHHSPSSASSSSSSTSTAKTGSSSPSNPPLPLPPLNFSSSTSSSSSSSSSSVACFPSPLKTKRGEREAQGREEEEMGEDGDYLMFKETKIN